MSHKRDGRTERDNDEFWSWESSMWTPCSDFFPNTGVLTAVTTWRWQHRLVRSLVPLQSDQLAALCRQVASVKIPEPEVRLQHPPGPEAEKDCVWRLRGGVTLWPSHPCPRLHRAALGGPYSSVSSGGKSTTWTSSSPELGGAAWEAAWDLPHRDHWESEEWGQELSATSTQTFFLNFISPVCIQYYLVSAAGVQQSG